MAPFSVDANIVRQMADDDTRFAGVKRLGVDELVWQHLPAGLQQGLGRPQPRHGAQLHAAANLGRDVREPVLSQFLQVFGGRSLTPTGSGKGDGAGLGAVAGRAAGGARGFRE